MRDAFFNGYLARCLAVGLLVGTMSGARADDVRAECQIGSYRLSGGTTVDIAQSKGATLRWRRFDGETGALHQAAGGAWKSTAGWTGRPDGISVKFPDCHTGSIDFNGVAGSRMSFDVRNPVFRSHGAALAGRLVMPKGSSRVPIVVLVHGSEQDSALIYQNLQRMLPAEGIGAFVYDKRGTGKSGGHYAQDFSVLADDVVAAVGEARRRAGNRLGRIGLWGGSEGGWVGPMAANRAPVDFVVVAFGLAASVIDEDQEGVALQMREKGDAHGESATASPQSRGIYRLPFADGTQVKVFDDFTTHRPRGRVDLYAIAGRKPYRVVAAAAGRIAAIQDGYSEQQSGRAAALCHNNYVWIAHPNGEWTNYSHVAHDSVTQKAHLKVGDPVAAGQYIGDEGAVGCAMLHHVHFEVAVPDPAHPIDSGGFLTDNDNGKRELNPRFCGVPGERAVKGKAYRAVPCG